MLWKTGGAGRMRHAEQLPTVPTGAELPAAAVAERLAPGKAPGVLHLRSGGRDGSERVVRATRRERSAGEPALSPGDDAQDPDLWVCDGNVLVAADRAEDRRGRGVPSAGSGELSAASDDLRLSAGAPSEVRRAVQASRSDRQEQRSDQAGPCGHRRNEGQSERQSA